MDFRDLVMAYAAGVGTVSLLWQAFTWYRAKGTRARVHISGGYVGGTYNGRTLPKEPCVIIKITNESAHAIRVESVEIVRPSGDNLLLPNQPDLPADLAPNETAGAFVLVSELEKKAIDPVVGITARAKLASGEQFTSKSTQPAWKPAQEYQVMAGPLHPELPHNVAVKGKEEEED